MAAENNFSVAAGSAPRLPPLYWVDAYICRLSDPPDVCGLAILPAGVTLTAPFARAKR